jgi:hypothetical protein
MDLFYWIGIAVVAILFLWLSVKAVKGLWTSGMADMSFKLEEGDWAVITGGTDGE